MMCSSFIIRFPIVHFHRIFFWSPVQSFSLASRWPLCRCLVSLIEFFGFCSLLLFFGWKAAVFFYPIFCSSFFHCFASGVLVLSHTVTLTIRALGEGCRYIGRWINPRWRLDYHRCSVFFPFPFVIPPSGFFYLVSPYFCWQLTRFSGLGYSIALGGLILFKTSGGK